MSYSRNIHFSILVRIGKQLHEFNFRRRSEDLYDGDTGDERGNRHYFKVIRETGKWSISGNNLPSWINENEENVCEALAKVGDPGA